MVWGHPAGKRLALAPALDTSTSSIKAMFGMLGVFAEFERSIIQDRVKTGLARARANGKMLGRARVSGEVEDRIRGLASLGIGKVKTARMMGVGVSAVQRVLTWTSRVFWSLGMPVRPLYKTATERFATAAT